MPNDNGHNGTNTNDDVLDHGIRLSKLISQYSQNTSMSRREAERFVRNGHVTVAGKTIRSPHYLLSWQDALGTIKVNGKLVLISKTQTKPQDDMTRVWIVHKLVGEVVAENDFYGRPSLLERLVRSGVGRNKKKQSRRQKIHLKPIGRLDMNTEGLILATNNGMYARDMELASNHVHRTYRVRVHGLVSPYKLNAMESGVTVDGVHYNPMRVSVETAPTKSRGTNTWLRITCTQGKNRQVRKILGQLGLTVTRLIRVSYGDYQLQTIPPGMALEVPVKPLSLQKRQGPLFSKPKGKKETVVANPVQWVHHCDTRV